MKEAREKLLELVRSDIKHIALEKESLNEVYQNSGGEGLLRVLHSASAFIAKQEVVKQTVQPKSEEIAEPLEQNEQSVAAQSGELVQVHDNKLLLAMERNEYSVLGALSQDLSSMFVTLLIEECATGIKERTKLDLYEREAVSELSIRLSDLFSQQPDEVEADLLLLTDLLEKYREKQFESARTVYDSKRNYQAISPQTQKQCMDFLEQPNLIERIDQLLEQTGIVGEHSTRKLLFVIASTYKMSHPLHSLVQGTSGSGKSHLINSIGTCFPPEDVLSMTRVTSKSFYHYNKDELVDKLVLIQDFDGLDEEAQYAFRELQSAGNISSSTTYKDKFGNLVSAVKTVKSHFASLLATTKAEIYYDNMSRSVIIGVDESEEQTVKIISHQNRKLAGLVDVKDEKQAREFLQNCMRCVRPQEVVNRYADKVFLPVEAKMLRRLNSHYQSFVKQITLLHQYQRKKDEQGRLITEPEDLQTACDILFDAIILKVDDLDSSLRQFFDRMKVYIKAQAKGRLHEFQFTQRDVRLALNVSKSQCFRYMEDLELLEYVQKVGGYANRGFKYKIVFWDDIDGIRQRVKEQLTKQLQQLDHAA
jgi:DNA polymerase III delta prime subunit